MVKRTFILLVLFCIAQISYAKEDDATAFLRTEVSSTKPYALQQVIYTVKVYTRKPLIRLGMEPPSIDGAQLPQLGTVQQYQTTEQGVSYYVAKVDYLFFSKKSGRRLISEPRMSGFVQVDNDPYSNYNVLNVEATTSATSIEVQPIPAAFKGDAWLPTAHLTVTDDWSADLTKVKVGESITRTVILYATGVTEAQLPDLKFPDIPGVSVYPDKPEVKIEATEHGLEATKIFKFAVVPTQAGIQHIPKLTIPWWDIKTLSLQHGLVPSATLTVVSSAESSTSKVDTHPDITSKLSSSSTSHPIGFWIGIFSIALSGWCFAFWLWFTKVRSPIEIIIENTQESNRVLWQQLKEACHNNQSRKAYHVSLQLARRIFPDRALLNLNDLAQVIDNREFSLALDELNQINYQSSHSSYWDGKEFFNLCELYLVSQSKRNKGNAQSALPSLFT